MCAHRLELFIKEMAMKGIAREALMSMVRERGLQLRVEDGVTVHHESDARYLPGC